jgi:hypothetical protein
MPFVTVEHCVFYKAGTEFINKIYVKFWVQIVNENRKWFLTSCINIIKTCPACLKLNHANCARSLHALFANNVPK